jgi:hypothetical protein
LHQTRPGVGEVHDSLRKPHRVAAVSFALTGLVRHFLDSLFNLLNHRVLAPLKSPHNKKLNRSGEQAGFNMDGETSPPNLIFKKSGIQG